MKAIFPSMIVEHEFPVPSTDLNSPSQMHTLYLGISEHIRSTQCTTSGVNGCAGRKV